MMKTSDKMKEKIKEFEGLRLEAYSDPAGVMTIGWGHTGKNLPKKITLVQAEHYLEYDISVAERQVNKYYSTYIFTQNEYDALVSFAFNIGNIDQLTDNGKRSKKEISEKMVLYVHAIVNGRQVKLQGLVKRRYYEQNLFLQGDKNNGCLMCDGYNMRSAPSVQGTVIANTSNVIYSDCVYEIDEKDLNGWKKVVVTLYVNAEGFTAKN